MLGLLVRVAAPPTDFLTQDPSPLATLNRLNDGQDRRDRVASQNQGDARDLRHPTNGAGGKCLQHVFEQRTSVGLTAFDGASLRTPRRPPVSVAD